MSVCCRDRTFMWQKKSEFAKMLKNRVFEVVFVSKDNKETFDFKSVKGKKVKYNGSEAEVKM